MAVFLSSTTLLRAFSPLHRTLIYRGSPIATRLLHNIGDTTSSDTEIHKKRYKIQGTGVKNAVQMKTNTRHDLSTDVPLKMGGTDTAPQPVEHLLAALIGCTQATAMYVGRMMKPRLIIEKIEFDLEGFRDERGALELPIEKFPSIPARLECVSGSVTVHFKKGNTPSEVQLSILKEQTEVRCPVANMMHASGCKMNIEWVVGNAL
jgi:putative redox protein